MFQALQQSVVRTFLIVFGLSLPLVLFELGLRVEQFVRKGVPLQRNPSYLWDDSLGWLGREHVLKGSKDNPILVLGDSFTEGLEIPSDQMWFAALKKEFPDREVIAYGGLGYGTLQELMVLRDYLKKGVSPSLILLQLCSNDIINNYFPLERGSYLQRAPGPRPYLEGGGPVVRFPRNYDWILYPLISRSRFAYRYNRRWDAKLATLARERKIHSVEFSIEKQGFSLPAFRAALEVTETLLQQFKEAAGRTKVVMMLVDDLVPYTEAYQRISSAYRLPLVVAARNPLLTEATRLPDGTHFNAEGNRIIGETLIEIGRKEKLFATMHSPLPIQKEIVTSENQGQLAMGAS